MEIPTYENLHIGFPIVPSSEKAEDTHPGRLRRFHQQMGAEEGRLHGTSGAADLMGCSWIINEIYGI